MNIRSLELKNTLTDENHEEYLDLSVPCFNTLDLRINDVHLVLQDEEGRVDKICEKYYGSTAYLDALCLANHIFNPFSIEKNEILVIPDMSVPSSIYSQPDMPEWIESTDTGEVTKTNEKDINRINRLKQKIQKKPNELAEGQSVKKYVNGKVILGTHINTSNE